MGKKEKGEFIEKWAQEFIYFFLGLERKVVHNPEENRKELFNILKTFLEDYEKRYFEVVPSFRKEKK